MRIDEDRPAHTPREGFAELEPRDPLTDQRRAAAVALSLAEDPARLAAALAAAGLPERPQRVAVPVSPADHAGDPAWALFDRAGLLLGSTPPGPKPRGTLEVPAATLIEADAGLAAAWQAGQRGVDALLQRPFLEADRLDRASFLRLLRLVPLLAIRGFDTLDRWYEDAERFVDQWRAVDARKRDADGLLAGHWHRLQAVGHLSLALAGDVEAVAALYFPEETEEEEAAGPPPPTAWDRCLEFGLIGPAVRVLRALKVLEVMDLSSIGINPPAPGLGLQQVLDYAVPQWAKFLARPDLADGEMDLVEEWWAEECASLSEAEEAALDPVMVRLMEGMRDSLADPKSLPRQRRPWLAAQLAANPNLAEAVGPNPPLEDPAYEAWEDRACQCLLHRPVDWRVHPEVFVDLLLHLLPWAMERPASALYPERPLPEAATAPPNAAWLNQHALLCQDFRRPQPVVRAEAKVGRNDPCPCGSGRKHKKCCGA